MLEKRGFSVLVTGASSGIGAKIAQNLAEPDNHLLLTGRDADRLSAMVRDAEAGGATVSTVLGDLSETAGIDAVCRAAEEQLPRLDALVLNAGKLVLGRVEEVPAEVVRELMEINFIAPYLLVQRLLPLLRKSRGQVIFINSRVGLRSFKGISQYAASKFALRALADSLRHEMVEDGIRVTSIYPGRIDTPMQEALHAQQGRPYDRTRTPGPQAIADAVRVALNYPDNVELSDIIISPQGAPL